MVDALLRVRNLECSYDHVMAVHGVSFDVPASGIVTLLGANGAGKSTILRAVSGALDPRNGHILFEGRPIGGLYPDEITRLGVSHVPEGREVFAQLTVFDNLAMGAYTRRDPDQVQADIATVYGYFPVLEERASQPAGQLSGGEQQMLAISRALMARPKLMLLDEPSLGLSPKLVKQIFEIVRRINSERGTAILLVEQNANVALEVADFGYILETGRIVRADTSDRLRGMDDVREFYLGAARSRSAGQPAPRKKKAW